MCALNTLNCPGALLTNKLIWFLCKLDFALVIGEKDAHLTNLGTGIHNLGNMRTFQISIVFVFMKVSLISAHRCHRCLCCSIEEITVYMQTGD